MEHFSLEEFSCPLTGENEMDADFLLRLDMAREYANTPFTISSGYRSEEHNIAVGGSSTSSHLTGHAADIVVRNSAERFAILYGLIRAGFLRIGIASDFIHVDDDENKSPEVAWYYG